MGFRLPDADEYRTQSVQFCTGDCTYSISITFTEHYNMLPRLCLYQDEQHCNN